MASKNCSLCNGTGWSRSVGARCDCSAPRPKWTPPPRYVAPTRPCATRGCTARTEERLCEDCLRRAMRRADVAFNREVMASSAVLSDARDAMPVEETRRSRPAPRRPARPSAPPMRARVPHFGAIETRLERDEDAVVAAREAFDAAEGPQRRRPVRRASRRAA